MNRKTDTRDAAQAIVTILELKAMDHIVASLSVNALAMLFSRSAHARRVFDAWCWFKGIE